MERPGCTGCCKGGRLEREGGTAVAVSTQEETAVVEGRGAVKSVSLLWSVMSILLLKITRQRTTGGSYRGDTRQAGLESGSRCQLE